MNMQNLMAQAKKIQGDMERATKEIESTIFYGENGVVKAEVNGKNEVLKITISDENIDQEMLEDMILIALNSALDQVRKMKADKLGKYTGGLGGMF